MKNSSNEKTSDRMYIRVKVTATRQILQFVLDWQLSWDSWMSFDIFVNHALKIDLAYSGGVMVS